MLLRNILIGITSLFGEWCSNVQYIYDSVDDVQEHSVFSDIQKSVKCIKQ